MLWLLDVQLPCKPHAYQHVLTSSMTSSDSADSFCVMRQLLGINCLRVPFSFQALFNAAPINKTVNCNPTSTAAVRANVIPPNVTVASNIATPAQVLP